jgi:hypothetical protein
MRCEKVQKVERAASSQRVAARRRVQRATKARNNEIAKEADSRCSATMLQFGERFRVFALSSFRDPPCDIATSAPLATNSNPALRRIHLSERRRMREISKSAPLTYRPRDVSSQCRSHRLSFRFHPSTEGWEPRGIWKFANSMTNSHLPHLHHTARAQTPFQPAHFSISMPRSTMVPSIGRNLHRNGILHEQAYFRDRRRS